MSHLPTSPEGIVAGRGGNSNASCPLDGLFDGTEDFTFFDLLALRNTAIQHQYTPHWNKWFTCHWLSPRLCFWCNSTTTFLVHVVLLCEQCPVWHAAVPTNSPLHFLQASSTPTIWAHLYICVINFCLLVRWAICLGLSLNQSLYLPTWLTTLPSLL